MIKVRTLSLATLQGVLFHDAPQHRSCHGMTWQVKHFHATNLMCTRIPIKKFNEKSPRLAFRLYRVCTASEHFHLGYKNQSVNAV